MDEASVLFVDVDDQHLVQVVVDVVVVVANDQHLVQVVPLQHLPRCLWTLHVSHQLLPSTHQMMMMMVMMMTNFLQAQTRF